MTLQIVAHPRGAFSIPCAAAAASLALASAQAEDASTVALVVPAGQELRLLASVAGEEIARWSTPLAPLAPGASIEVGVSLPEALARVEGVVIERATSRPIAGASIEPEDASDAFRCFRATSAADGRFTLPMSLAGLDAVARARAPGYAPVRFPIGGDGLGAGLPRTVELDRAAELVVRVRRPGGSPVPGIGVQVAPIPLPALQREGEVVRTDASGSASFADLPSGAPLQLGLYRAELRVRQEPDVPALRPGERRELAIELAGARVRGRVVDQRGSSVAGGVVGLRSASDRKPSGRRPEYVAEVAADGEGRFAFDDVPGGEWSVELAKPPAEVASGATQFQIGTRDVDVTIVAHRGLFISGEVVDAASRPVGGVVVHAGSEADEEGLVQATSDASGRFVLGPLGPREYSVTSVYPCEEVRARAGDAGVVVRLRPFGGLRGVVVAARTGAPVAATVSATSTDSGSTQTRLEKTGDDGRFVFGSLPPGRWRLEARTATQRGHLPELQLRAGDTVADLQLRVEPGAILEIVSPAAHARLSVIDAQGRVVCEHLASAPITRCVVEPGRLQVREYAPASGVTRDIEVSVGAGEQRRIDFGIAR